MEQITKTFIFNLALLASIVTLVITGHNGWAVFMSILLIGDTL